MNKFGLQVNEISIEEKPQTMEFFWGDDLSRNAGSVPFPAWHVELLNQRRAAVDSGEEVLVDWEEAKKQLMDALAPKVRHSLA